MTAFYDTVAVIGMFLCVYVMQATEHDRINKTDGLCVQWMRRGAFTFAALALLYSVFCLEWTRSLPVCLLVASADALLMVNAVALARRNSPRGRQPERVPVHLKRRAF